MDNFFDIGSLSVDFDTMERTNPIFNTAKMTLFQLAGAGDKDAAAIIAKLGLSYDQTQNTAKTKVPEELLTVNSLMLEIRYGTMCKLAEETGFGTEVDLPCGYTPRAIRFARKGMKFVGIDLPAAISEAEPVITQLVDEDKRSLVKFVGADATNYESLYKALSDTEGNICITTEGIFMYLTDSEAGTFCDNVRKLLAKHGGCWITADPEVSIQYLLIVTSLYPDNYMEILMRSKSVAEEKSDVTVGGQSMMVDARKDCASEIGRVMGFLAKHGLKAERLVLADNMPELAALSKFSSEQQTAIKQALTKCAYWKITPINSTEVDTSDSKTTDFDVKASVSDGTLDIRLFGRVDTITSPNLLALWEKVSTVNNIVSVSVDCSGLDYISSAGLRVLLVMHKGSEQGVSVSGANETVREIFAQTGFIDIFKVD